MEGIEKETEGMKAKDIPVVGKIYHVFDDGKISLSRHFLVKCKEVIPFKEFSTDPKYAGVFKTWKNNVNNCDWLYSETTDYVALCEVFDEQTDAADPNEDPLYYARTKYWGWFGFGTMLDDGVLDVTRKVWEQFYKDAHNPEIFGYNDEDLKTIECLDKF